VKKQREMTRDFQEYENQNVEEDQEEVDDIAIEISIAALNLNARIFNYFLENPLHQAPGVRKFNTNVKPDMLLAGEVDMIKESIKESLLKMPNPLTQPTVVNMDLVNGLYQVSIKFE